MEFTKEQLKGIATAYLIEKRDLEDQVEKLKNENELLKEEVTDLALEFDEYRSTHSISNTEGPK